MMDYLLFCLKEKKKTVITEQKNESCFKNFDYTHISIHPHLAIPHSLHKQYTHASFFN